MRATRDNRPLRARIKDGDPSAAEVWVNLFGQAINGGKSAGEATIIADVAAKAYAKRFRAAVVTNIDVAKPEGGPK